LHAISQDNVTQKAWAGRAAHEFVVNLSSATALGQLPQERANGFWQALNNPIFV
jgi:hypothetical protein